MAGLWLAALLAYSNSFVSGFILDNRVMLQDPRIAAATLENVRLIFTHDYWYTLTATGLYRPFTTLTYLFNYAVLGNGAQPAGWHSVNFALHAANLALVYALGLLLLNEALPALAIAALWALHPVLTESVTNIIGRADLLAAFGVLAGLLCHERAAHASGRRRATWLAGLAISAAIGIFSKESAVVLPALMALYDFTLRPHRSIRTLAPAYAAVLIPFALFFFARSLVLAPLPPMHIGFTDNPLIASGFWTARLTAIRIIGKYLWLLVWPVSLACDYSYRAILPFAGKFQSWADWQTLISLAVCVILTAAALIAWRRQRIVFFLIAFFFLTLAPTSNFFILIGAIMAERFLYLPAIAFAAGLVLAIHRFAPPRSALIAIGTIALLFGVRTFARNSDWLDDVTLWSSAVDSVPEDYKAHMALASALSHPVGAHTDAAIHEIDQAISIIQSLPDELKNPAAFIDAGSYYGQKGESLAVRSPDGTLTSTPQSKYWYQKALDSLLRARQIEALNVATDRERNLAAGKSIKDAQWYELYLELGAVYLRLDQPGEALEALEHGVRIRPVSEYFEKMSAAYSALGDSHRAAVALIQALTLDSGNAQLARQLIRLYQQIDPRGCSIRDQNGNPSLNPDCPLVHADLCAASQGAAAIYRDAGLGDAADQASAAAIRDLGCPASQFSPSR